MRSKWCDRLDELARPGEGGPAPVDSPQPAPGDVDAGLRRASGRDTVAYTTVFVTIHGLLSACRGVLERTGLAMSDHPYRPPALRMYARV